MSVESGDTVVSIFHWIPICFVCTQQRLSLLVE
jgi:hypothetical protein